MSAPEPVDAVVVSVHSLELQIIEIAALRAGRDAIARFAEQTHVALAGPGRVTAAPLPLSLCVRPERWLLLEPRAAQVSGDHAAHWRAGCAGHAVVTELSSALAAYTVSGAPLREMLARGCRLDLDPRVMPPGSAAATVIAQVAVILAVLPRAMLLLTPASTAQHFGEWLAETSRPFGGTGVMKGTGATLEGFL